ncbi:MAG: leucine-rich repeat protein [Eubacteriales bacterium]|nr:leucine-rich repeat protein [Eubacteriales bacterium]
MKNIMKRLLMIVAVLACVVGLQPFTVFAEEVTPDSSEFGKVHVIVENATFSKENGAPWDGILVDKTVELKEDSTAMTCIVDALGDYEQKGADKGYISSIHDLEEFDGGEQSGWMGTLNDWFTNEGFNAYTVANKGIMDGDEIHMMYTCAWGADIGADYMNASSALSSLSFSEGVLDQPFAKDKTEYTLFVPKGSSSLDVTAIASYKNYQVRVFSSEATDDDEKCIEDAYDLSKTDARAFNSGIKMGKEVPIAASGTTTLKVVCNGEGWPGHYDGTDTTVYTVHVAVTDAKITVPADASYSLKLKTYTTYNYQPFTPVEAGIMVENEEAGTKTYYYTGLTNNKEYYYRVSGDDYITYAGFNKFVAAQGWEMEVTKDMLQPEGKTKTTIDRDVNSNNGYNVADVYLNINPQGYLKMDAAGDTYQLINLRNWEAVNTTINNVFVEPDYHYAVINENGQRDDSVVSVSDQGILTAEGEGTAIVLVTYDAMNYPQGLGGPFFGASWPENTGVFVVSVGAEDSGIRTNMTINEGRNPEDPTAGKLSGDAIDAEHDIIYYLGNQGTYTFTPEEGCSVAVANPVLGDHMSFNGFAPVSAKSDGSFEVPLTKGRNIVKVTKNGKTEYQIISAKPVSYTVNDGQDVYPGDEIKVVFDKVYNPANKLAGVYNMTAYLTYLDPDGTIICGKAGQYNFPANQNAQTLGYTLSFGSNAYGKTVKVGNAYKAAAPGELKLTSGSVFLFGYGDPFGNHRGITLEAGKAPNLNAATKEGYLGILPDITIEVKNPAQNAIDKIAAIGEVTLTSKDAIEAARAAYDELTEENKTYVPAETLQLLTDAESKYEELKEAKDAADQAAAQDVIEKIKAADLSTASKDQLKAIQNAYAALSEEAKAIVNADAEAMAAKNAIDAKVTEMERSDGGNGSTENVPVVNPPAEKTVAVKLGTVFVVKGYKYKVTSNLVKDPTVMIMGYKNKKLTKINVATSVNYKNVSFKVTAIADKAFKSQKKAKSVVIGKNVMTIGKQAFYGDKLVKKITVKSPYLKKVGSKAFYGIYKKAVIKVPAKQLSSYKRLLKGKGQKKTVTIKK